MATKATRSIPRELLEYAKQNRTIINTDDFKDMARFGELLLVTEVDQALVDMMASRMVTLPLHKDTKLTGRQIACGLYIHKNTTGVNVRDIQSVINDTKNEVGKIYTSMTTKQPRAFNKRVSNTRRVPNATQTNPSRQVRSFSMATAIGKDLLLLEDIDDRSGIILELVEEFNRRGLSTNSPEVLEFGVSDTKVLSQLCMNPTELSPKELESAFIMAAIKDKENEHDTVISYSN